MDKKISPNLSSDSRKEFFNDILKNIGTLEMEVILLTHVIQAHSDFILALKKVAKIACIIAIPYSVDKRYSRELSHDHPVSTPRLSELNDHAFLLNQIRDHIGPDSRFVIMEIGGYYASVLNQLAEELGDRLVGIVEDTEAGHRRYEKCTALPCPVISIARSSLKIAEDFQIGPACIFSSEKLIKKVDLSLNNRRALVLGYGRVGRGLAYELSNRGLEVTIYDIDPIRRIVAQSEGFLVPDRATALREAEVIFGASGNTSISEEDLELLTDGVILASCSSRDVEFDSQWLLNQCDWEAPVPNIKKINLNRKSVYLLADGRPVNFLDGGGLGPVLCLVQAELLHSLRTLSEVTLPSRLTELDEGTRKFIASHWLNYFCS
ncbi:MAG: hypothetical protein GY847_14790 [Proteobacteria bacterium]|nr:hypothetical protein [Pseudomonadota bacterium]